MVLLGISPRNRTCIAFCSKKFKKHYISGGTESVKIEYIKELHEFKPKNIQEQFSTLQDKEFIVLVLLGTYSNVIKTFSEFNYVIQNNLTLQEMVK